MKLITFWFDVVTPYAYLAFEQMPQTLEGLSYTVEYKPVLFAGLLSHWHQKGPTELEPRRAWTYRQVQWLAHRQSIAIELPSQHPFNPLALLRLALASEPDGGTPNRRVVEAVFRHAWLGGSDPNDPERLEQLRQKIAPLRDPDSDEVKNALRANTEAAVARGIYDVPAFELDGWMFWGLDALPMLAAALSGDAWFESGVWDEAARPRPAVVRKPD